MVDISTVFVSSDWPTDNSVWKVLSRISRDQFTQIGPLTVTDHLSRCICKNTNTWEPYLGPYLEPLLTLLFPLVVEPFLVCTVGPRIVLSNNKSTPIVEVYKRHDDERNDNNVCKRIWDSHNSMCRYHRPLLFPSFLFDKISFCWSVPWTQNEL